MADSSQAPTQSVLERGEAAAASAEDQHLKSAEDYKTFGGSWAHPDVTNVVSMAVPRKYPHSWAGGQREVEDLDFGSFCSHLPYMAYADDINRDHSGSLLSTRATIASLVTAMIGTSILAMPMLCSKAGLIVGPLLLAGCGVLISTMGKLLCLATDAVAARDGVQITQYDELALHALGSKGKTLVNVTSVCALIGFVATIIVLIAQSLTVVFPAITYKMWIAIFLPINIGFSNLRDMQHFSRLGGLGSVCCLACVLLLLSASSSAVDAAKEWPAEYRAVGPMEASMEIKPLYSLWPQDFLGLGSVGAVFVFTFAVLVSIPTMRHKMAEPADMPYALNVGISVCITANLMVMLLGYWGFGNFATDNIIKSLTSRDGKEYWKEPSPWTTGTNTVSGTAVASAMIVNLVCSYPIYQLCVNLKIEEAWPRLRQSVALSTVVRSSLAVFIILITLAVPYFLQLVAIISSVFCVTNNIFLPILCYHATKSKSDGAQDSILAKAGHVFAFAVGVLVMIFGLIDAFRGLAEQLRVHPELSDPTQGWFQDS